MPGAPDAPRRFYSAATAVEGSAGVPEGQWGVMLDRFVLRTPAKAPLAVPSRALAEAIAAEWDSQSERIDPATMPITRLVNVAIDRTPFTRPELVAEVARYVDGDLTCYRSQAPAGLAANQQLLWDPVLDWVAGRFGVRPVTTVGLGAIEQPPELTGAITQAATALDDLRLTVLASTTGIAGSAFLAFALVEQVLDAAAVFQAIRIEEDWQAQLWGADPEEEARAAVRRADLVAAATVIASLAA